jgi:TRAP-type C4-dicarboxylate transport system permease small subunit
MSVSLDHVPEHGPAKQGGTSGLAWAFDVLLNVFAVVSGMLLVIMMVATVVRVVARAFFNHGILGVDQISGTMMVYIAFLGAAWVLRKDGHVTVDIFLTILPQKARRALEILGSLVASGACLAICYFSVLAIRLSLQRGIVVAAELEIPRAVNLIVIPIGCFLLGIEFIRRAMRLYRGKMTMREMPRLEA